MIGYIKFFTLSQIRFSTLSSFTDTLFFLIG